MPSTKKRINLTVPDAVYQQLRAYMDANAIESDATACLQLIKLQLKNQETGKLFLDLMNSIPREQLAKISTEGILFLKDKIPEIESK